MGKEQRVYRYDAYETVGGKWIGYVVEDQRLEVQANSKENALKEVRSTHNELLADMRKFGIEQ